MASVGLVFGLVGIDSINAMPRLTFGQLELVDGLGLVPLVMGLFGIAEILVNLEQKVVREIFDTRLGSLMPTRQDWRESAAPIARGSVLGFLLGILPGGGATIASFTAYAAEKRFAKNRDRLGQGAVEGVAAPEAANNSAATGAFVPLLTLGIPTNAVMAMLLAALVLHGVRPGPTMIGGQGDLFFGVIASMYVGNVLLVVLNLPLVGIFVQVLRLPYRYLAPFILLLCIVGSYGVSGQISDVWIVVVFGAIGWWLSRFGYDAAPFVLGLLLGKPIEENLRLALSLSRGSFAPFVERPISATLLGLAVLAVVVPLISRWRGRGL
jgi:putative tricarboxylic transport membrane protein